MDFFDNVMNKSNAIIKERLNNPFGGRPKADEPSVAAEQKVDAPTAEDKEGATPWLESTARQQLLASRDSNASNSTTDQNNGDKNSQFAAIAADAEAVAQKAAKGARNIGTFLFSMANKAGQTVTQTAKQVKQAVESTNILTDFTREQQEFIKDHGGLLQTGDLPWQDCADEMQAAYIREQILTLSQDKRNFVRSPPADCEFKFDPEQCYPQALSLLKEDPNLNKMRYELVPKLVSEDTFWCNYFYRVFMLKHMSEKGGRAKQGWSSSRSSSGEGPDEVGDNVTPHGTIDKPPSPGYHPDSPALDSQNRQHSFNSDKPATEAPRQSDTQQYEAQDLESSESRKLVAEADDLKSKLRELNIGSLDDDPAGVATIINSCLLETNPSPEDNNEWEDELQRDLQEFELVSGEDVDAYDEEILQSEILQLNLEKQN